MSFKISVFEKMQEWDMISVAKLTQYPLEKADYKPFVQIRCSAVDGAEKDSGIGFKFTVFEAKRERTSRVSAHFAGIKDNEGKYFTVTAGAVGGVCAVNEQGVIEVRAREFEGEDLQGVYWGFEVFVEKKDISFWEDVIAGEIRGNYYKTSRKGVRDHFGSFYPCDFSEMAKSPLEDSADNTLLLLPKSIENTGEFLFRRY